MRRYTKHNENEIKGPITVVSGKRRRLTFIECANDINSMIDIAKIADLVLLMIDGNFGFEMETMEFLNVLSPHGFPRILGITTHLDLFKKVSTMRASKKALKHRFWTEVYQGAKLFNLSGVINGRYPDREILNLARFISVMKFRPLKWRNEHPYILADRMVDLSDPASLEKNPKIDRKVALYGYVHGTPLPYQHGRVHIPGVGDLTIQEVERQNDPCPTPFTEKQQEQMSGTKRRRRLDDKSKLIYGPMSDILGVRIDKDGVYIEVKHDSFKKGEEKGIGERLVTSLQQSHKTSEEADDSEFRLFSNSTAKVNLDEDEGDSGEDEDMLPEPQNLSDEEEGDDNVGRQSLRSARVAGGGLNIEDFDGEEDDDEDGEDYDDEDIEDEKYSRRIPGDDDAKGAARDEVVFQESDSDLGEDELSAVQWKHNMAERAAEMFSKRNRRWDLNKMLYMDDLSPEDVIRRWKGEEEEEDDEEEESDIEADEDDDFFKKKDKMQEANAKSDDSIRSYKDLESLVAKWTQAENVADIHSRFYLPLKVNADDSTTKHGNDDDDEELYGDFEELDKDEDGASEEEEDDDVEEETEKTIEEQRAENAAKKEKMRLQMEDQIKDDREFGAEDPENGDEHETWHDEQKAKIAKQLDINKAEFDAMDSATRDRIEGFRAGAYVRMVFDDVPCEFVENFNPLYPIVVGGLLANEERFGFSQANIKRHRWHKKILKSNDPLIISLGWRRFQTVPIYTTSDSRTRNRMLKYTPEHMHCMATFYGPLVSPNTGFCAIQSVSSQEVTSNFRIAATGTITEVNETVEIVKKLKLVGYPYKIYKNTAFIKDMFNSSLEVAKFEGAQIKTVSGIRGQIKRALSKPDGYFRATFEDKILMSDIIILRAWHQILPRKFYNPVTSLLLSDKDSWSGMRLTGQVRAAQGVETPNPESSKYEKIERATRRFNPVKVPKSVQANLPFKSQIHQMKPQKKQTYMQKRAVVLGGEEKKARDLMQKVMTLRNEKDAKRKAKKAEKRVEHNAKLQKIEDKKKERQKREKKEYFQKEGRKRAADQDDSGNRKKSKK